MARIRAGWLAVAGIAACTSLVAACGSTAPSSNGVATKSAAQIVSATETAGNRATSVRVVGFGTFQGQSVRVDIVAGRGIAGGSATTHGATFRIVVTTKTIYLEAGRASWLVLTHSDTIADLLAGRWLATPTSTSQFRDFHDVFGGFGQIIRALAGNGPFTKGEAARLDRRPVVAVTNAKRVTLYVATTGTPYLESVHALGPPQGTIRFEDYGTARLPAIPRHAVPLGSLEGAGVGV